MVERAGGNPDDWVRGWVVGGAADEEDCPLAGAG